MSTAGEPVVYSTEGPWTNIFPALAHGSKARVVPAEKGLQDGIPLVWGLLRGSPEIIEQAIHAKRPWVYLDHGYFKRGHFSGHYRMTWCDFQQRTVKPAPADRWESLRVKLHPWRKGRNIIVCPPSDHVAKLFGAEAWLAETLDALGRVTDRPITVRRKGDSPPLPVALQKAHALVAMNSLAAVEAATWGTPVFVSTGNAAAPVGKTDLSEIETPSYPDREEWARSLAYGQFTISEMRDGTAWRLLRKF